MERLCAGETAEAREPQKRCRLENARQGSSDRDSGNVNPDTLEGNQILKVAGPEGGSSGRDKSGRPDAKGEKTQSAPTQGRLGRNAVGTGCGKAS